MFFKVLIAVCLIGACVAEDKPEHKTLDSPGSPAIAKALSAVPPYPYTHTYHGQDGAYSFEIGSHGPVAPIAPPSLFPFPQALVPAYGTWLAVAAKGLFWVAQHLAGLAIGSIIILGVCKYTHLCHKFHPFHSIHKWHKIDEVELARAEEAIKNAAKKFEVEQVNNEEEY